MKIKNKVLSVTAVVLFSSALAVPAVASTYEEKPYPTAAPEGSQPAEFYLKDLMAKPALIGGDGNPVYMNGNPGLEYPNPGTCAGHFETPHQSHHSTTNDTVAAKAYIQCTGIPEFEHMESVGQMYVYYSDGKWHPEGPIKTGSDKAGEVRKTPPVVKEAENQQGEVPYANCHYNQHVGYDVRGRMTAYFSSKYLPLSFNDVRAFANVTCTK